MSNHILARVAGLLAGISLLALPVASVSAAAGTGTGSLSITPTTGSYSINSTFSVTVKETSSTPVAGIQADLHYDPAKLQCLGVDGGGSAFVQQYQGACSNGNISIARTTQGTTLTGTQTVATVSFKALAGSGQTTLTAAGTSEIIADDASTNVCNTTCTEGKALATYTLTTPAPAPAPTQPTNTTPAPKAATTTQPAANRAVATAQPTVLDVDTQKSATITEEAAPKKAVKIAGTVQDKKSYTATFIVLGLLAALVAAVVIVRKVVDAKQASLKPVYVAPVRKSAKKTAKKKAVASKATRKTTK